MWANADSYDPAAVEDLLQAGELCKALENGWFGDEWSYRLIHSATLPRVSLTVASGTSDLGLDLRNDDGVATVGRIVPGGACDGAMRCGDVIRMVDGARCYTCEAAVRAIKAWRTASSGEPLSLEAVRPPVLHTWRDALELRAGAHAQQRFETHEPACLTYWFCEAREGDVGLSIVRLDGDGKALRSRSAAQIPLLEVRGGSGRGHVLLPESSGGHYAIMWDNGHSFFLARRVRYVLRCVPLGAWEVAHAPWTRAARTSRACWCVPT